MLSRASSFLNTSLRSLAGDVEGTASEKSKSTPNEGPVIVPVARDTSSYEEDEGLAETLSESDVRVELKLDNLVHSVKVSTGFCKEGDKEILHGISANFRSGQLCCLMGPSGAGKTSLLTVLATGRNPAMTLNGGPLPKNFGSLCCTIPQADILYPALSPEQSLRYSAMLRLPETTTKAEIEKRVEDLLEELRLVKCRKTPIGNDDRRGVSGGERKRVSIGVELIANPRILFVDEPSSGLDSKSAEDVIRLLRGISRRGRLVICTIHQPSWGIFEQFDKLLLLHHGYVVYQGRTGPVLQNYFNSHLGLTPPAFENPLDYYMRQLQTIDVDTNSLADKWAELSEEKRLSLDLGTADAAYSITLSSEQMKRLRGRNSWLHQFKTLLLRNAHDTLIDKEKFVTGLAMKFGIGLLLGIVFINQARPAEGSESTSYSSIFTSTSPIFFLVLSAVFDTLLKNVIEYPLVRQFVVREFRNGAFNFGPYIAAQIANNTFFDVFASLFYLPTYFLVGLGGTFEQFLIFLATLSLITMIGTILGLGVGSFCKDINEAQGYIMPIVFPLLIFSGFLLPLNDIPDFFLWLYYISPFQYSLSILLINEFEPRTFLNITTDTGLSVPPPHSTGKEYLASIELYKEDLGENFAILSGTFLIVAVLSFILIRRAIYRQAGFN